MHEPHLSQIVESMNTATSVSTFRMGFWDKGPIQVNDLKSSLQSALNIMSELSSGRLVEVSYRDTHKGKSITARFTPNPCKLSK